MKNKKGFTLVELLASVVILGLLTTFALPTIVGVVEKSRNKVYISDARKLISNAEYEMKSKSSIIEKPEIGDCIAISMEYLGTSDFTSPPNGGTYEKDYSFVVVKNTGNQLEYSATLVEKMKKGGYKGVKLSLDKTLLGKNSLKSVVLFDEAELVNIDEDVDKAYINKLLGSNYLKSTATVSAIYHYPDLIDTSTDSSGKVPPVIKSASLTSLQQGLQYLDTVLTVHVDDADTPRKNIEVFYSLNGDEDLLTTTAHPYGDSTEFTTTIKLGDYGYRYDGTKITVYVMVLDPEGNTDSKNVTYEIHNNDPPVISDDSGFDNDVNMLTAKFKLSVSDDLDALSDLQVCLFEHNVNAEDTDECENYQKYYDVFSKDDVMKYTFQCDNGDCKRDGSTHFLQVFVKDTYGAVGMQSYQYDFSTNQAPVIGSVTIRSKEYDFLTDGTGSLDVYVTVDVSDDADETKDLMLTLSDGKKTISDIKMDKQKYSYDFSGNYDGKPRKLTVTVTDTEGGFSTVEKNDYQVYGNQDPKIIDFSVSSSSTACLESSLCPTNLGGSKVIDVILNAKDDIDSDEDLLVCVSTNKDDCSNLKNFESYAKSYLNKAVSMTLDIDKYEGQKVTLYASVRDSYGQEVMDKKVYQVYQNQAPIASIDITSQKTACSNANECPLDFGGDYAVTYAITVKDDLDSMNNFEGLQVCVSDSPTASCTDYRPYSDFYDVSTKELKKIAYKFTPIDSSKPYDGTTRKLYFYVKDSYGASTSGSGEYQIYQNQGPDMVGDYYIKPAQYTNAVEGVDEPLADIYYYFGIVDDFDTTLQAKFCYYNYEDTPTPSSSGGDEDSSGEGYTTGKEPVFCSGPVSYNVEDGKYRLTNEEFFHVTKYEGQTFMVSAVFTDSYGVSTIPYEYPYTVYSNDLPIINTADAVYSLEDQKIMVSFSVQDINDYYHVCVSESESVCNNYSSDIYDGSLFNTRQNYDYHFENPDYEGGTIYLYVKDFHGNVVKKSITATPYTSCGVNGSAIYEYSYATVNKDGEEFDNQEITINLCEGKCYDHDNIFGYYYRTVTYFDKYVPSKVCNPGALPEFMKMDCSFYECYKKNNNYNRIAIGTKLIEDSSPWMETIDGEEKEQHSHYNMYSTSYVSGDEKVRFMQSPNPISPDLVDKGYYDYDATSDNPYIRVDDHWEGE